MTQSHAVSPDTEFLGAAGELSAQALYDKCMYLARNLWWTWHPEVIALFRDLDPIRWRQLDHNPIALLHEFTPERLASRASEMVLYSRINYAVRRLKEYLATRSSWGATNTGVLGGKPVAYSGCTSRCPSIPVAWESSRAITSRVPVVWGCLSSPWACSTVRGISDNTWTMTAIRAKSIKTRKSKTPRSIPPVRRMASR